VPAPAGTRRVLGCREVGGVLSRRSPSASSCRRAPAWRWIGSWCARFVMIAMTGYVAFVSGPRWCGAAQHGVAERSIFWQSRRWSAHGWRLHHYAGAIGWWTPVSGGGERRCDRSRVGARRARDRPDAGAAVPRGARVVAAGVSLSQDNRRHRPSRRGGRVRLRAFGLICGPLRSRR